MSVVNHFEISLICLLHCMYYDITTNNKLIVFGGTLRRNGTPPLFDVLPFEINNENYLLLIGFISTNFDNFPRSSVG